MRWIGAVLLVVALVGAADSPAPARLSLLLATPTDVKLGVSVDGRGIVFPLEYRRSYGPFQLAPGRHQVAVKVGAGTIKSSSRSVAAGSRYLVAVAGPVGDLEIVWVKLGLKASSSSAKLRLVNLVADAPPLALKRGSDVLEPATAFGKTSSLATLAPGALPIEVSRTETGSKLYAETPALGAGKAYTLLVLGTAARPESLLLEEP